MAYQALYRKYRPHSFEDFIDQDNVKKILINSLKNDKISHAYLFSGPRGIGKTSLAKIFAKAVNCLNFKEKLDVCEECDNCLECDQHSVDIIEIDAASNNGVDQIRDLKNKINIVPSQLKYKVYIVDEVHMLTNSAFNALLKTLEEPPSHVIFILATTEFYEVPETIVSRCQCFSFSRITMPSLEKRLRLIAEKEKIKIKDDVIVEIAQYSNGGLRDAIGMLDKLNSFTEGEITLDDFKTINGLISFEDIKKFYENAFSKNYLNAIEIINKIESSGYDFQNFIERMMSYTRDKIMEYYTVKQEEGFVVSDNVNFISALNDILNRLRSSNNPKIIVEVYMLRFMDSLNKDNSGEISTKNVDKIISREIKIDTLSTKKVEKNDVSTLQVDEAVKNIRINNVMATANMPLKMELMAVWENLNTYFLDEAYGKVAQLLSDTTPMVVANDYVLITSISEGLMNNIYNNFAQTEKFVSKLCERNVKIVVITSTSFDEVKKKYIEDKKHNITYQVQKEDSPLVIENNSSLIKKALDVFGSEYVEIE